MTTSTRYLSCAETAKLVRAALKREFPGVKFSVKSDVYSGGASINVKWPAGEQSPSERQAVEVVAKAYEGADFDGMVDLKTYRRHYLRPDGTVMLRSADAMVGYEGYDATAFDALMAAQGIEAVHFGADFIFCERTCPVCGWGEHASEYIGQCQGANLGARIAALNLAEEREGGK